MYYALYGSIVRADRNHHNSVPSGLSLRTSDIIRSAEKGEAFALKESLSSVREIALLERTDRTSR